MKFRSLLLGIMLVSPVSVLAQEPVKLGFQESLASMAAGEKFTSEECGFTIALPQKPSKKKVDENGTRGVLFSWDLKEGNIIIKCTDYLNGAIFTTDRDRDWFLKGYVSNFEKNDVKSIKETAYSVREFKGKTFSMLIFGKKFQTSVLLAGKRSFEIGAMVSGDTPNAEALLFTAANSFNLSPPPVKQ